MANQSPTSAMLSEGLAGSKNPYLARYRAQTPSHDIQRREANLFESSPSPARLWPGVWPPELSPSSKTLAASTTPSFDDTIRTTIRTCDDLLSELQSDLLNVSTATFSSKFATQATVCLLPVFFATLCVCVTMEGCRREGRNLNFSSYPGRNHVSRQYYRKYGCGWSSVQFSKA